MAEVLVMLSERATGDEQRDTLTFQRGDVLSVREDDFAWSEAERTNPLFHVVSVPGISVSTLYPLTISDSQLLPDGNGGLAPNPTYRLRRNRIDLVVLQRLLADVPAWLALLEDGGQEAAFAAGLIVPVAPPPSREG